MQSQFPTVRTWSDWLWLALATFLASGGAAAWYTAWKNRKKPAAEVHLSEAQTEKTFAEAEEIRIRSHRSLKEMLDETSEDLIDALNTIEELQKRCAAQEIELQLLRQQMDGKIAPSQRPVA